MVLTGPRRPVTRLRSTPGSSQGRSRVPGSRSIYGSIRDAPPRFSVDNICRAFKKAMTALYTIIDKERTNKDEERFAAV